MFFFGGKMCLGTKGSGEKNKKRCKKYDKTTPTSPKPVHVCAKMKSFTHSEDDSIRKEARNETSQTITREGGKARFIVKINPNF